MPDGLLHLISVNMPGKRAVYCKEYYSMCRGSISIFSTIIFTILKAANVSSFLLWLFLDIAARSFIVKDFLRRKYDHRSP